MSEEPKAAQSHQLLDRAMWQAVRRRWSLLINTDRRHELQACHHLIYLALTGRDWRKAFTPITRPKLLANGRRPYDRAYYALMIVRSPVWAEHVLEPFEGVVTPEQFEQIVSRLPRADRTLLDALPDSPYVEVSDETA